MSVMRTVLAIKSMGQRESLVIIPELKDYDNVHTINITGGKVVEPVVGHDVIAHLLVKAVKILPRGGLRQLARLRRASSTSTKCPGGRRRSG